MLSLLRPPRLARCAGTHRAPVLRGTLQRGLRLSHDSTKTPLATELKDEDGSNVADYQHPVNVEEYRRLGYEMVDFICDYFSNMDQHKVKPDVKPGYLRPLLPASPPEQPEQWQDIMADLRTKVMPGVLHWQSPHFFAYYPGNTSFPGMLAEMAISALGMVGFSWQASPVSTEMEMVMMDWLAQLCGLPSRFLFSSGGSGGGVIQGTSSEAVLVAALAARSAALRGRAPEDALRLVAYASDQTHSCFKKACMILGLQHVRVLPTSAQHEWALQPEVLAAAMEKDVAAGLLPFFVCATIGTTSSCAVDPVPALADVAHRHGAWAHVDAAYAGSAAVCPEHRHVFDGLDTIDSYSFNPHKWLLVTFDCCAMWVADATPLREALSLTPVFLQGTGNDLDYKDWQIPLGRRFRALKLWMVMRMYGAEKLRAFIRHSCSLAAWFAGAVSADPRFELAAPPRFGLVCFRLKGAGREANEQLLLRVNDKGPLFIIHTVLDGQYTLRFAVGAGTTQLKHVQEAWDTIRHEASLLLATPTPPQLVQSNGSG